MTMRPLVAMAFVLTMSALLVGQEAPPVPVPAAPVPSATPPAAGPRTAAPEVPLEKQTALLKAVKDGFAIVEYTFQYDKGDAPQELQYPGGGDSEQLIREERPLQIPGILIDATHVLTPDIQVNPRFIKSIKVGRAGANGKTEAGGAQVAATVSAYPKEQRGVILELAAPLNGAKAIVFDVKKPGPYFLVQYGEDDARWVFHMHPFEGEINLAGDKTFLKSEPGLIVDGQGTGVGVSTGADMAATGWKSSPTDWAATPAAAMTELLQTVEQRASKGIVAVTLNFRSPQKHNAQQMDMDTQGPSADVQHVLGVVIDDHSVLVLAEFKPNVTARLERIRLLTDPPVEAKFEATLQDYGAFVVTTEQALSGGTRLSKMALTDLRDAPLPSAEIYLQGETRVAYFQSRRIGGFNVGWHGNAYPQLSGRDKSLFLFDPDGQLLALPVSQREKASTAERYRSADAPPTAVTQIAAAMASLKEHSDPNNVPLSEEQENRLAWLGFELQGMTQELARANSVADQTSDGETGGLVTYVYPDSPAAKAGVEPGWILLRIDVQNQPKPIDVHVEGDRFGGEPFPWDQLGEAPEAVFDRIPTPWPSVETSLTRTLTDLGFGMKFVAEFSHGGKIEKKDFTVTQGPPSYESAPKYKFTPLGLTVRNMTYEVRRYMQKKDDEPGVVISKIELGSKASSAGLKPYEVITNINDQPVMNVQDFEKLSKGQSELRLNVKRMTTGRIVKITVPATGAGGGGTATQGN